jgi:hypothetical protein
MPYNTARSMQIGWLTSPDSGSVGPDIVSVAGVPDALLFALWQKLGHRGMGDA